MLNFWTNWKRKWFHLKSVVQVLFSKEIAFACVQWKQSFSYHHRQINPQQIWHLAQTFTFISTSTVSGDQSIPVADKVVRTFQLDLLHFQVWEVASSLEASSTWSPFVEYWFCPSGCIWILCPLGEHALEEAEVAPGTGFTRGGNRKWVHKYRTKSTFRN